MANDHNFKVKNGLTVEAGNIQVGHDATYGESGSGRYVTVGFGGISNGSNRIFAHNTGGDGLYLASASGRNIFFRTNGGGANTFTMTADGSFKVGGTAIITSARNLTNIGTISSGTVTSSGNLVATSGYVNTANQYLNGTIRVLNSAGDGWNDFASRTSAGIFNLASIGTISTTGSITAGNSSTNAMLRAHYNDGSYMTLEGYGLVMNRGASYIRPSSDGDKTLYIGGADASLDWNAIHFRSTNGLALNGTNFIDASRNLQNIGTISAGSITGTYFLASGADTTPAGTTFANAFNGSTRVAYFDGDTTVSTWYGSGNTPYAAIDATNGNLKLYVNDTSGNWHQKIGMTSSGVTHYGTVTSTGVFNKIDSGSYAYFEADGNTNQWKWLRLSTNGTTAWDIAARNDDLSNALQFRPGGGATNRTYMDTSGNWTMQGDVQVTTHEFRVTSSNSYTTHLNYLNLGQNYISQGNSGLTQFRNSNGTLMEINSSGNVSITNDLTVSGNFSVLGTTTTLNTATLQVEDKNIVLNYGTGDTSGSANGAGITIQDAVNSSTDASITWSATNDRFVFSHPIQVASIHSGAKVSFLDGSSAQGARFGSIYVGTTYANDGSSSGTVDTLNGYRVGGTTVIDSGAFRGRAYIRHKNSGNVVVDMDQNTYTMFKNPLGETRLWLGSSGYSGAASDTSNYYNGSTHFFRNTGSSELARINSNGVDAKVGGFLINGTSVINSSRNIHNVGTISATGHLDIANPSGDSLIRLAHTAGNNYDAVLEFSGSAGNIATEGLQIWYDNSVGDAHFATTYAHDDAYLRFHTRTGASKSTSNERLTIAGHGTVGINKSSGLNSSYKLHMGGHIHLNNNHIHYINQAHFNQGTRFLGSSASTTILRSGTSTNSNWIGFQSGSSSTTRGYVGGNSDGGHSVGLLDSGGSWAVRHVNDQGTMFSADDNTQQAAIGSDLVSGDYGGMVLYSAKNGYVGYSLNNRSVFMHNNSTVTGIYNDVGNEWYAKFHQDGAAELYHNGYRTLFTQAAGAIVDSASGQSTSQIHFKTNGTSRGYVYANTSNNIGFLDAGGDWAIRHINDQGTEFRTDNSTVRAAIGADLVGGDYGSMVVKEFKSSWAGYSINNQWVFMSNSAGSAAGLYNDTDNKWALYMDRNAGTHLYYNGNGKLSTNNTGISVTGNVNASGSLYAHNKKVLDLQSNSSSERGPWNPIVSSIRSSGRMLYKDEEFWTGSNNIGVYNNAGGGTVTHTREADTANLGADAPNGSGMVIRIYYNGGSASPGFGGFVQSIPSEDNHTFVQIFQAKLPSGKSLQIAENQQGDNKQSYFLTSNAGTGKWEWYARVSHCGDGGTFSGGGHIYVTGGSGAFTWYLASCTVYDVTEHPVASKLELLNDRRNLDFKTDSTSSAGLLVRAANDAFRFQLYGDSTDYGFLDGAWANWDIKKTTNGKLYLNGSSTYFIQPEAGDSAKFAQFVQIGDSSSYGTNSGSWGARLNVTDNIHSRIDVGQDANSMLSYWYAHTGQDSIKFGTSTAHDVEFQRAGSTSLEIEAGGIKAFVPFRRSSHHASGFLEGSYNNVGANGSKSNPIYTIGSSYNPTESALSNMYGIGYTSAAASFASPAGGSFNWGMYVAADGDARVWLDGSTGNIWSSGDHYVGSNKVWHAGNDGTGSGLDADTLDGYNTSTSATANTVVVREGSGHIYGNYILGSYFNASSGNNENPTIGQVWTQSTSDNYLRKSTPAHFRSQLGLTFIDRGANQIGTSTSWDITEAGMYGVVSSSAFTGTNNPGISGLYTYGVLSVFEANGNGIAQLYTPHTGNKIALRTGWNNGGWYGWQQVWTSTSDGSGSGLDADLLDGIQASSFLRSDTSDSITGNLTVDNGTSTTLTIKCDNGGNAIVRAGGDSQGTGVFEVTQDGSYGGGMSYNGDASPAWASGETADHITFYRMDAGTRTEVFHYPYNSSVVNFNSTPTVGSGTIWHSNNDGSGSGLDADLLDGLQLHTGRNNEANKVVRTDGNGYIQAGWINTTSGNLGVTLPDRIYASNDGYIRYIDLASFRARMNVTAKTGYQGRESSTSDTNYWIGSMGWGSTDMNTLFHYGSGSIDAWSTPNNAPSGTSHWVGSQHLHYTNGTNAYGHQIVVGAGNTSLMYIRGRWGTTFGSWQKMWNAGNDGSGSGLDADLLDGLNSSSFVRTDATSTITSGNTLNFQTSSGNTRGMIMASESIPHLRISTSGNESIGFYDGGTSGTENVRINGSGGLEIYNDGLYMQNASTGIIYSKRGSIKWDSTTASSVGGFIDRHGSNSGGLNTDAYPSPIYSIGLSYMPSGTGLSNHYGVGYAHTNASFYSLSGQSGWGFYVSSDGDARVQLGGSNGTISCTGNVVAYASDGRLKTNVKPIENALDKVMKIRGVEYDWVENITTEYDFQPTEMHEVGVIAQEVQEVLPEVVREAPFNSLYTQKTGWTKIQKQMEEELGRKVEKAEAKTKYEELPLEERQSMEENYNFLTVDYERIVPLLIEGIKELKQEVDDLKAKLKEK